MAIRDKIVTKAAPFLDPGEQVQVAFPAQTKSGWLGAIGAVWLLLFNRYRQVIATDRRILVTDGGKWAMGTPKSVVRELPRATEIGQPGGMWWKTQTLGETLYVHKRFHKDVIQADAARGV